MKNKFSIIIPMYNSESYIKRCLESIINQTYYDIEIILINDGSTDNTLKICEGIAKIDHRIKIIDKKNEGVSIARNTGIKNATGDYIIFVDSDDWIELDAIEILNNLVTQNDVDLIIHNIDYIKTDLYINSITEKENELARLIVKEKINAPWNKLYKSSFIKQNNIKFIKDISIAEDLLFNIEYFINIDSLYLCHNKLYNCDTSNNESLSRKYNPNKYEQLMFINDKISKIINKYDNKKVYSAVNYIKMKNIISCCLDLFDKRCPYNTKQKKKIIKQYKKENKLKIITNLNIKIFMISFLYKIIPAIILFYILKVIKRNK